DADGHEAAQPLGALAVNVTTFYRNAEAWAALLRPSLVDLWRARRGRVRAWSAGCASGEEPYSVAVAIAEAARACGETPPWSHARVDASDIDRESLERTAAAEYPEVTFSEMP